MEYSLELPKKLLGKTDLLVSSICLGCAPLGSMPDEFGYEVPERQAVETVLRVFESSMNFLDTANLYGRSEERIGLAIKEYGGLPKGFVVATKADRDVVTGDLGAEQVKKSVYTSLERLGLKSIPLVYLHDPEYANQNFEELMVRSGAVDVLEEFRKMGLINHIGISGGPVELMNRFVESGRFDVVITHNRFNLVNRSAEPIIQLAYEKNMGIVNAAIYGGGILVRGIGTGQYAYKELTAETKDRIMGIESLCETYKIPMAAAALQFSLKDRRISSTVIGMSSQSEVDDTLKLAQVKIPEYFWEEISKFADFNNDPEKN